MGPGDFPTTALFGVPLSQSNAPIPASPNTVMPSAPALPSGGPPQRYVEQDGKHRGGAGIARDIFGTLGDFLLTKLGLPPMYAEAQHKRRLAAAQANFDTDPLGSIQQVTSIDPVFGAKLRDQYIDNTRLAATQASTQEARQARLQLLEQAAADKRRLTSLSALNTITSAKEEEKASQYKALRERIILQNPEMEKELPETFDPNAVDTLLNSGVPLGLQRGQMLTKLKIDNQDEQADASLEEKQKHNRAAEINAAQRTAIAARRAATSGGRTPKPTNADIISALIDKEASGKPLTPGEKARVRNFTTGKNRAPASAWGNLQVK